MSPTLPATANDTASKGVVVVIDDVADLVDSVVMLLEMEGYAAFGANDGPAGIRRTVATGADLVVLDFLMPDMNGGEIGAALRAEPSLSRLKILMVSATPEALVRHSFAAYDGFLAKPVFAEDLIAAIDALIGGAAVPPRSEP